MHIIVKSVTAFLLVAMLAATGVLAQRQIVIVQGIPALRLGAHAGADYDGDGDEDVFITGRHANGTIHSVLYRFNRRRVEVVQAPAIPRVFAEYSRVDFLKTSVLRGSVNWHDLNHDGRPDLIVTGLALLEFNPDGSEVLIPTTNIYRNDGDGNFTQFSNSGLPDVFNSKVAVGDFNGDGVQDIVLGGDTSSGLVFGVWLGGENLHYSPSSTSFVGLHVSSISTADIDGDGDLDFIVAGINEQSLPLIQIYTNDGTGRFTLKASDLPQLFFAGTAFGDLDFDGDADLLINGAFMDPAFMRGQTRLYLNDGAGNYTQTTTQLAGLFGGGVLLRDLDGDTDLDIFSWGIESLQELGSEKITVSENIDSFFLPIAETRSIVSGAIAWFDYDGNGRLDAFLSGDQAGARSIFIYEF